MNPYRTIRLCAALMMSGTLPAQGTRLAVIPARPEPGALVRLVLTTPKVADTIVAIHGTLAGEPLHFMRANGGAWHAIGGIPIDATGTLAASAEVTRTSGRKETVSVRFALPKLPPPPAQPLDVDSSFTRPDPAIEARIARENARAREIGERSHGSPPIWTAPFIRPRTSVITSEFGSGRLFNGRLTARHLGVDFRGAVGDPIRAANRGVVALVANFFLAGNVVYIDHGGGVVTAYFHMSKPLVSVGDTVARGQIIGRVGATGRVTGPHLHWAARYGVITVNPLDLLAIDNWYSATPSRRASHVIGRDAAPPVRRKPLASRSPRPLAPASALSRPPTKR